MLSPLDSLEPADRERSREFESFYSYEERANALEALGGMFSCLSMLMIDRSISRRFPLTDTTFFYKTELL